MKYRIKWTATRTGKTGYGTGKFPEWQAEATAKGLNDADKVRIVFTIEAIPKEESEPE